MACIEDEDGDGLDIAGGMGTSPAKACQSAAKKLRGLADRFDLLAQEKDPCNCATHDKVNKARV